MSEKITREAYNDAVEKAWEDWACAEAGSKNGSRAKAGRMVTALLKAAGITVEPPPVSPILPGVAPGEWTFNSSHGGCIKDAPRDGKTIHTNLGMADGKLMAGSKELVELVVDDLRDRFTRGVTTCNGVSRRIVAIVDQLEKIGVNCDEFRGDE